MPKKNKQGKGGKDAKGEKGGKLGPEAAAEHVKILYISGELKRKIDDLQEENKKLKVNSQLFRDNFQQKIEEQEEIIIFLEQQCRLTRRKKEELSRQLDQRNKEIDDLTKKYDGEMTCLKDDKDSMIRGLRESLAESNDKLDQLHTFQKNKSTIEEQLEQCIAQLDQEKRDRSQREAFLERRFLSERERLKKEMLRKIRETKLQLLAMTEDQLHTTTKRTIMENEQMTIELQYQSKETEKLLATNDKVQKENDHMKRQIAIHKKTEKMLATRTHFLQKLVDQLQANQQKQTRVPTPASKEHDRSKT